MLKKLFGKKLKEIRKSKNLTQEKLAELLDMQTSSIGAIEIGRVAVSFSTIENLAKVLDVDYQEFFNFSGISNNRNTKEEYIKILSSEAANLSEPTLKHLVAYTKSLKSLVKKLK